MVPALLGLLVALGLVVVAFLRGAIRGQRDLDANDSGSVETDRPAQSDSPFRISGWTDNTFI
jgi:hypothetical protein